MPCAAPRARVPSTELGALRGRVTSAVHDVVPGVYTAAWISGSLVEGFGNARSDVDVFVLVDSLFEALPVSHRSSDHWTYAFFIDETRVDIEYWPEMVVTRLAAKLADLRLDDPDVNTDHYLSPGECEFIHRLRVGWPLDDAAVHRALCARFDMRRFARFVFENSVRRFEDAFDDAVGMLESGQESVAALRAREGVEHAIDTLIHGSGLTNQKTKFRSLKLRRLAAAMPEYAPYERALWHFQTSLSADVRTHGAYAREALQFAADLVGRTQDQVYDLDWAHVPAIEDEHGNQARNLLS